MHDLYLRLMDDAIGDEAIYKEFVGLMDGLLKKLMKTRSEKIAHESRNSPGLRQEPTIEVGTDSLNEED